MNIDDVNRDPALHRTPLGRLRVLRQGEDLAVEADDGRSRPRIIHVIAPGGSVFDALYGKNALMQREIRARYEQRDEERRRAYERQVEDEDRQIQRRLLRLFGRFGDEGRAAVRRMLGAA
jgi:FtsZ-binding cell division protein ZapB